MQQLLKNTLKHGLKAVQNKYMNLLALTILVTGLMVQTAEARERVEIVEETLPAPIEYIDDTELPYGVNKVLRQGVGAKYRIEYHILKKQAHYSDLGNIKSKAYGTRFGKKKVQVTVTKEIERTLLREAKHGLVLRGMHNTVKTENGIRQYQRKFIAHVSAYTHIDGSHTASGLWPRKGLVAVDTDEIPLFTKLYIPGYGECMAADTGGDIEDNCIDVFFEDEEECYEWGRRDIEVFVLKN